MMQKAIFLDKDGTLIPDIPYNVNPALITLQNNLVEGLKRLQSKGYLVIVISNQSGVARGYFAEEKLQHVKRKLENLLKEQGVFLDGFYYCPHHPGGTIKEYAIDCNCRKPLPGLIYKAAKDFNINLEQSWMIGDILNDVEAGNAAGCGSILIENGNETEWILGTHRSPDYVAGSIDDAAEFILSHQLKLADT